MKSKLKQLFTLLIFVYSTSHCVSQTLTIRDVFDAQIGDFYTFELRKYYYASDYFFRKVINKETFGNDSLRITYFEAANKYNGKEYERQTRTFIKTYTQLDSPYFSQFDQRDTVVKIIDQNSQKEYGGYEFNDTFYTDTCGHLINRRHELGWAALSGQSENTTIAIKGVGVFDTWFDSEGLYYKGMEELPINYSTNSILCGRKNYMPLEISPALSNEIIIYPNPVNSILNVSGIDEGYYCIRNCLGQIITSGIIVNGEIQLNELPAGNYIIDIITETVVHTQLLIKN